MVAPQSVHSPASPLSAAELCVVAELEEEAAALLAPQHGPREYVEHLLEQEQFEAAARVLAHALPKREAIWWAWVCARRASGETPPDEVRAALEATERWITQPSEANRRPMLEIAEKADIGTPAGAAAVAVFLSGGSVAPPEAPPVEPAPYTSAKAIAGSVFLSGLGDDPDTAPQRFQAFIRQGLEVAKRIKLWPAGEHPHGGD